MRSPVCKITRITRRFDGMSADKTLSTSCRSRYSVLKTSTPSTKKRSIESAPQRREALRRGRARAN